MATPKGNRKRRNYSKRTSLFAVLSDHVTEASKVKAFLLHRMGKPPDIDFQVVKTRPLDGQSEGCSLVELSFNSFNKAGKARYLLNKSNRNTTSKILSYYNECQAIGAEVKNTKKHESEALKVTKEIVETAQRVVGKHDDKINLHKQHLKHTEAELTKKRGVSLDVFDMLSNEKLAREDKLRELESQRKEFGNYVVAMKEKIVQLYKHDKFEAEIRQVRKSFGVECSKLEHALPIYARREDILDTVKNNQVSVILGETGSGKSTQMVQYLYQAGFAEKGLIACTQPRKIAATSLATHVSGEMASRVGQEVGYQVGMQSKKTGLTKVVFMTDHILLNECLRDNDLSAYSCVIIDEAHERSIFTDLLIGMLKECMKRRPELRVVITSATIDPDVFVSYFGGPQKCPVLQVSGRTFPVEVMWVADNYNDSPFPDDYQRKALDTAIYIHSEVGISDGDILVFLTSQAEIERCCETFKRQFAHNSTCLPLHGKLKAEEQQLVFAPNAPGKRKVVFATNSAETSITIPGIKFVVDTGVAKEMRYDPKRNMNSLDVVPVSQSSANQRKGRAGRTAPGVCYRLYTEADYNQMKTSGCPEILRVHLGQAMLKLMELKVNPMTFQFVESPSPDAMTTAFQTLVEIGAVTESSEITELGQWIAKLPVEPRLGAMIKAGIDADVAVEVLIVAASCSQGGIFYRAGTKEEKKQADLKKVRFCHPGGDLLTVLNVYREWDKINEKGKGGWCKTNYINGKAIKGVREMVKEILTTLQKECKLKIKYELKTTADHADSTVQRLLFKSYKSNVSFYLGHEKAGYITTKKLQHVQIHPSSCLHTLALKPTWVVFNQLLKTTEDFITNITPVAEEDIDDAVADELIEIDKEGLKKRKVECVLQIPVGKHVYWKFVGPMHQNRREIESNIQAICNDTVVVIEADKIRGEVSLYCVAQYKDDAAEMLQAAMRPLPQRLLQESKEEPIGHDRSNVRALLRHGCAVIDILMPHQYRSINIKQKDFRRYELTEENVEDLFSQYGPVEQVWRPFGKKQATSVYWGKVTFVNEADAVEAVREINEDEDCDFTVVPIKHESYGPRSQEFTIRLSWCRRPGKGICYVYAERPEDIARLIGAEIQPGSGECVTIEQSRAKSDLTIKNIPSTVTEEEIKEELANVLGVTIGRNSSRFKVIIPRGDKHYYPDEMNRVTREVSEELANYVEPTSFKLNVKEYKEKTAYCVAFVKFQDAETCSTLATELKYLDMRGTAARVSMEFKSSAVITKRVYDLVWEEIDACIQDRVQRHSSTTVQVRTLKSGNIVADISAKSPLKLAKMKLKLDTIIEGDTLEIGGAVDNLQVMFTAGGRQKKQQIEKASGAMISMNDKSMKVTVQGLKAKRHHATALIKDYIAEYGTAVERSIMLKGDQNPAGLMKAVLTTYGSSLDKLQTSFHLLSASLNLHEHILTLIGNEDALVKVDETINVVKEKLIKAMKASVVEDDTPDCPVCLCPVEFSDCQRLEYCGHAYCRICLISMMEDAIKSRKFPLQCATDGCGEKLVMRDITTQMKLGKIKQKEFAESAVSCYVGENSRKIKFCITPDCDMVYKVSTDGTAFHCFQCQTEICTTCHEQFHQGMTCQMYKSAKTEKNTLQVWLQANPDKRKLCPKCGVGIEKIEGCDHMNCTSCRAHICWKCLKYFSSSRECYGHLDRAHGSFV